MAKAKKKRADKYEGKLAINGSFEDVIKASVTPKKLTMSIADRILNAIKSEPFSDLEPSDSKKITINRLQELLPEIDSAVLVSEIQKIKGVKQIHRDLAPSVWEFPRSLFD